MMILLMTMRKEGDMQPRGKNMERKALLLGDLLIAKSLTVSAGMNADSDVKAAWASEISSCVTSAVRGAFKELDFVSQASDDIISNYTEMSRDKTGSDVFITGTMCGDCSKKKSSMP